MKLLRKYVFSLIAILLMVYAAWPSAGVSAARIFQFEILANNYLIAGKPYRAVYESDRAFYTRSVIYFSYSVDNGRTWSSLPPYFTSLDQLFVEGSLEFRVPIDPELTSAMFRVGVKFIPLVGSDSYSESIAGPFKILQPAPPSNVKSTANEDGTVTLAWDDNSNMEQAYRITRYGPDGTKTFLVSDSTDHVGPLVYTDKSTNKAKDTIYVYSLSMDFQEEHQLPAELDPGSVNVSVKTKAPIQDWSKYIDIHIDPKLISTPELKPFTPKPTDVIITNQIDYTIASSLWEKLNKDGQTLPAYPVSGVQLGSKAVSLQPEASIALIASVQPEEATNKKLVWSSDNPAIVSVNSAGQLTGVSAGTANVRVKTEEGGFSDICVVTVADPADNEQSNKQTITDLDGHPASREIAEAVGLGIVNGYPDSTFRPEASVTRAEFAAMLMRGLKPQVEGAALTFKDKAVIGDWAIAPVAQSVQLGIINGYGDNTFRPNAKITRAEMITMVMRASGVDTNKAPQLTGFTDDKAIPAWAKPSVSKAQETGIIIVGGINAAFEPQVLANRAEAASAIVRMLKLKNTN
ncbi:S-layer homology domain-containing protein [Paenibacillus sp. GXUN7292]|uniref:S-layer homology domain-containing protein n=1 Tax=Paenibacillus sp. GXUN7292 TaxID=3422499 RepID=UPI003D7D06C6